MDQLIEQCLQEIEQNQASRGAVATILQRYFRNISRSGAMNAYAEKRLDIAATLAAGMLASGEYASGTIAQTAVETADLLMKVALPQPKAPTAGANSGGRQ